MQEGYSHIVVLKTAAMFLVMLPGWWAARRGGLAPGVGAALSRLVVDVALPALILGQMLRTVTATTLAHEWHFPLLIAGVLATASAVGIGLARLCPNPAQRRTLRFVIATPNWIYLPLPIVQALFGDAGIRAILLGNVGAQIMLWTVGLWLLRGGLRPIEALRHLVANPGLLATAAGLVLALAWPQLGDLARGAPAGGMLLPVAATLQALELVGSLTIPLSLFVTGIQLGALPVRVQMPDRALILAVLGRLVVAPAAWWGTTALLAAAGVPLPGLAGWIPALVAAMPVALTCSVFAERFDGDTALAAQAVFWSTLLSLASVPLAFALLARVPALVPLP